MTDELERALAREKEPCDLHDADFADAASFVADGLAFEAGVVSYKVHESSVVGLADSQGDLFRGLFKDPLIWLLLAVGLLVVIVGSVLSRQRSSH
jgi:hypothetical protein